MITADLSEEVAHYLALGNVNLALATEIQFASGVSRFHSATGQLEIGGEIFYGAGQLGDCSVINEENNTSDQQINLTLSGLNNELVSVALNEKAVGCKVICYIVVFDDDYTARAYNVIYVGKISQPALNAGATCAISYNVGNIFQEWSKNKPYRFTDESHVKDHPGDKIFRYVGQMSERSIYWGSKKDAPGFNYV